MPVRRLNFTKRQRILQKDVEIFLREQESNTVFDARLDLTGYGFPADARVFVEAYRQTTLARFDFGTVSVLQVPLNRSLNEFDTPAAILFRVRVTDVSARKGILLGEADRIRPREQDEKPDRRIPLLPPRPDDIEEEVWRVEYEGGATCLVINKRLPDWKETARSPSFRALVFPAAMRQILARILHVEGVTTIEDGNDWRSLWLRFAASLPGSRPVPNADDEYDDWIEDAVAAFARRARLFENYSASEEG